MSEISKYKSITPQLPIFITKLYTIHYFENYKNYYFHGEKHDFWELLYVDRGEILVETDRIEKPVRITQGDILIHRPNEFHSFYANNIIPHNLVVLSFECNDTSMEYFQNNVLFHTLLPMRAQIGLILEEAKNSFSVPLGDPDVLLLERNYNVNFGGEQIIKNTLEMILISLYRRHNIRSNEEEAIAIQSRLSANYTDKAIAYMKDNLYNRISLSDICTHATISRSQLQKSFRHQTGLSVMRYLMHLRIEESKFLIRSCNMNFTEIAEKLCYSSLHHFSSRFHNIAGISPTEYASSVKR